MKVISYSTGKQRERHLFYILALVMLSSPLQVGLLVWHGVHLSFHVYVVVFGMMLSIPFKLGVELILLVLRGENIMQKIFIKSPSVRINATIDNDYQDWIKQCKERMTQLGFTVKKTGQTQWKIFKPASEKLAHGFLILHFDGELCLKQEENGLVAQLTLIIDDTVIIETGEYQCFHQLGQYLLCQTDEYHIEDVPFTLGCAISLAIIAYISTFLAALDIVPNFPYLELFVGAFGMSLFMIPEILSNPRQLIGFRLAFRVNPKVS